MRRPDLHVQVTPTAPALLQQMLMQFMQMGAGGAAGTRLIFPAPAGDPRVPLLAPPSAHYLMDLPGRGLQNVATTEKGDVPFN